MTIRISVLLALLAIAAPLQAKPSKALRKRLAALAQLEEARSEALTLIRDEVQYVKGNPSAQREVNRLTVAVEKAHARVEAFLRADVRKLRRKKKALARLNEARPADLGPWDRALLRRLADRQVLEANERAAKELPRGERPSVFQLEQLRITNAYRMCMGLRALSLRADLGAAAHGHSDEMRRLRYFEHSSPTQGHETPFKRAKLAGFEGCAVGENIAKGYNSPRAVHKGWLKSPGHHRNIVDSEWEVMGVANVGDLWTQVFGRVSETSAK
jgi:hypothetical protein